MGQSFMNHTYGIFMGHMRHISFVTELGALEVEAEETNIALWAVLKKLGYEHG